MEGKTKQDKKFIERDGVEKKSDSDERVRGRGRAYTMSAFRGEKQGEEIMGLKNKL